METRGASDQQITQEVRFRQTGGTVPFGTKLVFGHAGLHGIPLAQLDDVNINLHKSPEWQLSVGHGVALLQALERVGIDSAALMAQSGMVLDASDLSLSEPDEAVGSRLVKMVKEAVYLLETTAASETGDPPPHPHQHELMWFAAAGCPTLANAIGLIELYTDMLGPRSGRLHSEHTLETTSLVFERSKPQRTPAIFLVDVLRIVMADRMLCWLAGNTLKDVRYELAFPRAYAEYLPAGLVIRDLGWDCVQSALLMPADARDRKVVRTPSEVAALFPLAPILLKDQPEQSWAWRIAKLIDEAISEHRAIPSLDDVAKVEFCSVATVRRRLEVEGATFQQIKNDRRRAWAIVLLQTKRQSVDKVAEHLGFADEAAFRRAFKQWTGKPPVAYSRNQVGKPSRASR